MEFQADFVLRKKRELLGTVNKRKMSLRRCIDNLKQNDCQQLEISQVTKCVFLGALHLKPVPHLFDSPMLVKELDMKLGIARGSEALQINSEIREQNSSETIDLFKNKKSGKKEKMEKEPFRPRRKLLNDSVKFRNKNKNKINVTMEMVNPTVKTNEVRDKPSASEELINNLSVLQPLVESGNLEILPIPNLRENKSNLVNETAEEHPQEIEFIEMCLVNNRHDYEIPTYEHLKQETVLEQLKQVELVKPKVTNFENPPHKTTDGIPIERYSDVMNPKQEYILSNYGEEELLDLGDKSPEILLPDSDDDAIDQLMFSIMDIKVEPNMYYGVPPADDMEEYEARLKARYEEIANANKVNEITQKQDDSPDSDKMEKKFLKRKPQCKICSKEFNSYMKLKKHKMEHNGDKPYPCVKCGETHTSLDQLIAHLRTHEGKRPYVCKKCNQGFKTMKGLENHKPIHILKKPMVPKKTFRCEVCCKEFRKLCDLDRHTRVHTGEKPSVCNICNRRFQQAHNLNKHLLIHTQEKPYECDICNRKFGRNDVLNRHLLTHAVKKPNDCEICNKSFIRLTQLQAHKIKYHSEQVS